MGPDYFDVLPIRPPLQPLESLTSYLTRLAEANGIPTLCKLQPLFFPERNVDVIQEITDLPQRAWGCLPKVAFCAEGALQTTTFYELVKKFGRPLTPLSAAQFLGNNVAPQLRYCPLCLQTDPPHYILPWRFILLTGCAEHGCRLLDRCSACGTPISFLPSPLKMNRCPHCGIALSAGRVEPLDDYQYHQVQARYRDLAFLLSAPRRKLRWVLLVHAWLIGVRLGSEPLTPLRSISKYCGAPPVPWNGAFPGAG